MSELTHAEATDLAGLYVLDALSPEERAQVDAHLASCPERHDEFAEVGGIAPALASLVEPKGAPASLKNKVMADYRAGAGATVWTSAPVASSRAAPARPAWLGWAAAAMAVLVIAAAGWGYLAQSRADAEAHRSQMLAQAIEVMAQPDSQVAMLSGTGPAAGAHGFAVVSSGKDYIVVVDLPQAPAGQTYQAWYIIDGVPASAGLVSVYADGIAVMELPQLIDSSAQVIALTIEPAGGSDQPTTDPVVSGGLGNSA